MRGWKQDPSFRSVAISRFKVNGRRWSGLGYGGGHAAVPLHPTYIAAQPSTQTWRLLLDGSYIKQIYTKPSNRGRWRYKLLKARFFGLDKQPYRPLVQICRP